MFSKELFAQRVREVRKLHGETQKMLGEVIDTKANNVSEIESGKKTTTSEKIAKLCRHYNVSADYLLGLSDDPRGGVERWTEKS
jgi:transcriptional regulator with XRE-family HTH domain